MSNVKIRLAEESDLTAISDIYNYYVLTSTCTYQTEPDSLEERIQWFRVHDDLHPITVAEVEGQIVAWASLSRYHSRSAYQHTVEDSIYVQKDMRGRGIGKTLLTDLIERANDLRHHSIIATISADQIGSIVLHERFGFRKIGQICEVGRKFGRWLDVALLQRML
jgi:L-amino acid N-acyltransferase YncA